MSLARQSVSIAIAVTMQAFAGPAAVAQPDPPPPPESIVCPAIEEDGLLCATDSLGMDGNCADFVVAAGRLGALYRTEVQKLSGSKQALLTTSWWGCGPASLSDVKRLLARLGSEPARAVLQTEPYRSLPDVMPAATSAPETMCIDLQSPVDRVVCVGAKLEAAREAHRAAFERCKAVDAGALREELLSAESSFQSQLQPLCAMDTAEADENTWFRAFDRSECLANAYRERTKSMLATHPECTPGD